MSPAVLVLVAGDTPDAPISWARIHSGVIASRGVAEAGAVLPAANGGCVLILPGFEAQLRILDTPARSAAQARAAAAYLFRGALATAETETLFAVGEPDREGAPRLAAAMSRARLAAWLARCSAAKATPTAIYLDCAIWPVADGAMDIVRIGDRTVVATGARGGFTIDSSLAPTLIESWLAQPGGAISEIRLSGWRPDQLPAGILAEAPRITALDIADPLGTLMLAAAAAPAHAPDLAQGGASRAGTTRSPLKPWLLAAGLAAVAGLLQVGVTALDGMRDANAAEAALASAETEFRVVRPDVKRITNLRAQVTAALNSARRPASNPILTVSPAIADVLAAHPAVQLDEIRHETPGQSVSLRFSTDTPPELDSVIAGLRAGAGSLDVGPMQAIDGRSSITVAMGAS